MTFPPKQLFLFFRLLLAPFCQEPHKPKTNKKSSHHKQVHHKKKTPFFQHVRNTLLVLHPLGYFTGRKAGIKVTGEILKRN